MSLYKDAVRKLLSSHNDSETSTDRCHRENNEFFDRDIWPVVRDFLENPTTDETAIQLPHFMFSHPDIFDRESILCFLQDRLKAEGGIPYKAVSLFEITGGVFLKITLSRYHLMTNEGVTV